MLMSLLVFSYEFFCISFFFFFFFFGFLQDLHKFWLLFSFFGKGSSL